MPTPSVIAIDGPVASGKTTVGRELAARLGYRFVDTGLMYRALTLVALRRGIDPRDGAALGKLAAGTEISMVTGPGGATQVHADGGDVTAALRTPEVEGAVSVVAQVPAVRHALVAQQQRIAEGGNVVMVGRDIGTKVLPNAAKVFLTASPAERARRRHVELEAGGSAPSLDEVRENLALRDTLDSERAEGPLRVADDAVLVETEGLAIDEVVDAVVSRIGV
ncbi:MAG: (d)CMP kinase [Chloroflexi bacterium]|nr:(d)CMP kinase [Chloroflexota bacterium]